MAALAADLPDPVVRLAPRLREMVEQPALDRPPLRVDRQAVLARLVEAVEHLAVDVELQLAARRVADPHRLRALVAVEPRQLELAQAPLARDAVHDLDVGRIARDRPDQPAPPLSRLVRVVAVEECEQRERRVAQPAVAVVPVAHGADPLRQRGRRRGDDAAGRVVGERLEDDERPPHERCPVAREVERTRLAPLPPEALGVGERLLRVDPLRNLLVRGEPGQDEGHPLALVDGELRNRAHVLAASLGGRAEAERVRARDRDAGLVLVRALAYPRDDAPVVEADRQLRAEADAALDALDDPHDVRRFPARRHEVEDARNGAVLRRPRRLEDERVVEVAARARCRRRRLRAASGRSRGRRGGRRSTRRSRSGGSRASRRTRRESTSAAVCRSPRSA